MAARGPGRDALRAPAPPPVQARGAGLRAVAGVLSDGTVHYVPVGEVWADDARVCCHLCGRWFRSVVAHLKQHGWSRDRYVHAFGLEQGVPLEGAQTRERRAASFRPRRTFDARVREGVAAGYALARSGELTAIAAKAARGRKHSPQRRVKTLQTLAGIPDQARTDGTRRVREAQLRQTAAEVAARSGHPSFDAFVLDHATAGRSLAETSRAAGLHKDWLQRHLQVVAPRAAAALEQVRLEPADRRWLPVVHDLGFADISAYLETRHCTEHRTIRAISLEVGFSRHSVQAALRRHGLDILAHATKRAAVERRELEVAERLGHRTLGAYLSLRRAQGRTWSEIADETGQPRSWIRRRAAAWGVAAAPTT